jgi:hypothetical protein
MSTNGHATGPVIPQVRERLIPQSYQPLTDNGQQRPLSAVNCAQALQCFPAMPGYVEGRCT